MATRYETRASTPRRFIRAELSLIKRHSSAYTPGMIRGPPWCLEIGRVLDSSRCEAPAAAGMTMRERSQPKRVRRDSGHLLGRAYAEGKCHGGWLACDVVEHDSRSRACRTRAKATSMS